MVVALGSHIAFTGQTVSISNYDVIEIVRPNVGFNLANGINEGNLEMTGPHYYLEVREI